MSETTAEAPTLELHFKPVGFWSGPVGATLLGVVWAVAGAAIAVYVFAPGLWRQLSEGMAIAGMALALIIALLALRARAKPARRAPLRAFTTHLELPATAGSSRTSRVEYSDILSLNVAGSEPRTTLFLGTPRQLLGYPKRAFVEPDAVDRLMAEVRRQLARRPDGHELIARMAVRDAVGRAAWAARPVVTLVLLSSIALGYLLTDRFDATESPLGLLRFGANAPVLIADGQWFRLFAANFLHANAPHLYMNGLGLLTLGSLLERLLGPWRLTSIYLLSAFAGSAASAAAARGPLSVGASTAIFGLLGALAWIEWRFRQELPAGFRQSRRWWFFILGLNAILPLLVPQIDFAAHAGGFFAGMLATRVLCAHPACIRRPRPAPRGVQLLTLALVALFAVALARAVKHALHTPETDQLRVTQAILSDRSTDAASLNEIAWGYAVSHSASRAQLELALRAAASATALAPESPEILDTLATLHFRLGELERAIELERRALGASDDPVLFSQLARFLSARSQRRGPLEIGPGASARALSIAAPPAAGSAEGDLVLRVGQPYVDGAEAWILMRGQGKLQGAFLVRIGPTEEAREWPLSAEGFTSMESGPDVSFETALVDVTSCRACPAGSRTVVFHPLDSRIASLPGPLEATSR